MNFPYKNVQITPFAYAPIFRESKMVKTFNSRSVSPGLAEQTKHRPHCGFFSSFFAVSSRWVCPKWRNGFWSRARSWTAVWKSQDLDSTTCFAFIRSRIWRWKNRARLSASRRLIKNCHGIIAPKLSRYHWICPVCHPISSNLLRKYQGHQSQRPKIQKDWNQKSRSLMTMIPLI